MPEVAASRAAYSRFPSLSRERPEAIRVAEAVVPPGQRKQIDVPVARLVTGTWASLPVVVLNGRFPGPRLWLDAAIHGDELNGMEVIRQVLAELDVRKLRGSILAVPVVNVFGFLHQTRYLPDRRDLNRSFPGSVRGSLASRLAHLFLEEVVSKCQYGIDLHTGAAHRTNLPQVRAQLEDPEIRWLAEAFDAPMLYTAPTLKGSLRAVANSRGIKMLVYEAGEPLRFNDDAIRVGVRGVLRVLDALGMWPADATVLAASPPPSFEAGATRWVRASRSGIFHRETELGSHVASGDVIGYLNNPFSSSRRLKVKAPATGMIIGFTRNPLVHQGDALVHVAEPKT